MGAGPSKGCAPMGGAGLEFLAAAALGQAASRAAAGPLAPEELIRNPARAMMMGADPIDLMMNLAIATAASNSNQRSSSDSSGQSGQNNSGSNQNRNDSNRSPASGRRARRRSTYEEDPSSETNHDPDDISEISYHFHRRLTRFARLGGIGQFISEQTGLTRNSIFRAGPSQFQDRSSAVPNHHAAHVVRVQITERIERDFPEFFEPLSTFVGHTHIVPRYANVWYGIGGEIDRIQARFLPEISTINFREEPDARVEDILRRLKRAFLDVFERAIASGILNDQQAAVMQATILRIEEITLRELFGKGREGLTYIQINM